MPSRPTWLYVSMPDGSTWRVSVEMIAEHRAKYYAHEFDGSLQRSLAEDTWPLFESSGFEVTDWARNNMNWSDVVHGATKVDQIGPTEVDYQEGWNNGEMRVS